ncbi:autophagy-related protein 16-1-like [Pristis pectinata]|uniref:autophagy-related protein 16-1-like n=1 Tax=Pristis pectinata TaxID=685728 RepID=UPI00223E1503|nr:autophagy-related protein 16-1-like [Pristis pectinata]
MAVGAPGCWRANISWQLRERDRNQKQRFQAIIISYNQLLEKSDFLQHWWGKRNPYFPYVSSPSPEPETRESQQQRYREEISKLQLINGELAQEVFELNKDDRRKEVELQATQNRLAELLDRLGELEAERQELRTRVADLEQANRTVKEEYDALQLQHQEQWQQLRTRELETSELIHNLLHLKAQEAQDLNNRIEKPLRAEQRSLQKDLAIASSMPISAKTETVHQGLVVPPQEVGQKGDRSFKLRWGTRSGSFGLPDQPKFLQSFKGFFRMRSSASCSEIDFGYSSVFYISRVPVRVRHSVSAHDGEVNAVKFSPNSKFLATGGSDTKVKLWDVVGGTLQNRKTLEGSNDGVTSIDFDSSGQQLLAGSYDNSARLWSLRDCELKHTLSGHSAKVTAAKFKFYFQEVVTGSHDRMIKTWDLNKLACVKSLPVPSRCSDIVCSDYCIISGHFDKKVRLWDSRSGSQTDVIALQEKVTSLDINQDRTQLLSCSRDDLLSVMDLRMNKVRKELRSEGFKCGADWTKAIFSPDGNYAVAGSSDGTLHVWDVLTGDVKASLSGEHRSSINAVSWSQSGEYLVSVDRGRVANLWTDY